MLTPDEIRAAKELADEATPGPWTVEEYGDDECPALVIHHDSESRICFMATPGSYGDPEKIAADAKFVANARTLVSALCDTALSAMAERDAAMAVLREAREKLDAANNGARFTGRALAPLLAKIVALLKDKSDAEKQSWYCDRCAVEVYQVRCQHCGKTQRERK